MDNALAGMEDLEDTIPCYKHLKHGAVKVIMAVREQEATQEIIVVEEDFEEVLKFI